MTVADNTVYSMKTRVIRGYGSAFSRCKTQSDVEPRTDRRNASYPNALSFCAFAVFVRQRQRIIDVWNFPLLTKPCTTGAIWFARAISKRHPVLVQRSDLVVRAHSLQQDCAWYWQAVQVRPKWGNYSKPHQI